MKVYYYHTQDIQKIYTDWSKGNFPGHFLYGATCFKDNGICMIMHKHIKTRVRWRVTLNTARQILGCREHYDALYATSFRGIEIVIFLRALGLYKHPVILWHHQPIVKSKSFFRESLARLYYRGIDQMFFFSQKLIEDSLCSKKARREKMHVAHWGADLDFYDKIMWKNNKIKRCNFVSTGGEMRDIPTLINAFNATGCILDMYIGRDDNIHTVKQQKIDDNIKVHFIYGFIPNKLAVEVNKAACVVICCLETNYTVGLTTLVEAMALGLPMICSRNPQIPINIDKEGCGITVDYGDVEGWINAINYIAENPEIAKEMGQRGRTLAERLYNIKNCTKEVSEVLLTTIK